MTPPAEMDISVHFFLFYIDGFPEGVQGQPPRHLLHLLQPHPHPSEVGLDNLVGVRPQLDEDATTIGILSLHIDLAIRQQICLQILNM